MSLEGCIFIQGGARNKEKHKCTIDWRLRTTTSSARRLPPDVRLQGVVVGIVGYGSAVSG